MARRKSQRVLERNQKQALELLVAAGPCQNCSNQSSQSIKTEVIMSQETDQVEPKKISPTGTQPPHNSKSVPR